MSREDGQGEHFSSLVRASLPSPFPSPFRCLLVTWVTYDWVTQDQWPWLCAPPCSVKVIRHSSTHVVGCVEGQGPVWFSVLPPWTECSVLPLPPRTILPGIPSSCQLPSGVLAAASLQALLTRTCLVCSLCCSPVLPDAFSKNKAGQNSATSFHLG